MVRFLDICSAADSHTSEVRSCIRYFEYTTIAWNLLEGGITIILGFLAGSVALVGFGLDSAIEVFVSLTVLWQLRSHHPSRESRALRFIAFSYLAVAAYIAFDAVTSLMQGRRPNPSVLGIIFLSATVVIMYLLAFFKRQAGNRL